HGTTGADGGTKDKVNDTLDFLSGKGAEAATLTNGYYWSSYEGNAVSSWLLSITDGNRLNYDKNSSSYVRITLIILGG
ncbi:MAG: hypothetical protein MJ210_00385, partial [Alphaproteobacteria bacterium]|nr:hypothetical protein [Alphaproteobacteria bacterium]